MCPGLEKMKGMGMEDQTVFVSPWALSSHDEEFFTETVRNLGEVSFKIEREETDLFVLIGVSEVGI